MESKSVGRSVLEGLGILSVVLSLAFVAFQIKQSTDQARATMSYDISMSFGAYHDLIAGDAELAGIRARLREPEPEFTDQERERAFSLAMRLFNAWMSVHRAHLAGVISSDQYESYRVEVEATVARLPGAIPLWSEFLEARPHLYEVPLLAPLRPFR